MPAKVGIRSFQYLPAPGFRRGDKKGRNSKVSLYVVVQRSQGGIDVRLDVRHTIIITDSVMKKFPRNSVTLGPPVERAELKTMYVFLNSFNKRRCLCDARLRLFR